MRSPLAPLIVALCASCAAPAPPLVLIRPAPEPGPVFSDCRAFTASSMEAGKPGHASGTACRQPDGRWLVTDERPLPAAAIAWASPVPSEAEQDPTVYYAFDPLNHRASLFDSGRGGGWWDGDGDWHRHRGGFGGFRHGGFGAWRD